ncbi:hypothetical protein HDU96_002399 [Phlyctochytrium bullatum]|nr:hypothetical protein HDU96_002399 [Phlyctochytrium bullatum]
MMDLMRMEPEAFVAVAAGAVSHAEVDGGIDVDVPVTGAAGPDLDDEAAAVERAIALLPSILAPHLLPAASSLLRLASSHGFRASTRRPAALAAVAAHIAGFVVDAATTTRPPMLAEWAEWLEEVAPQPPDARPLVLAVAATLLRLVAHLRLHRLLPPAALADPVFLLARLASRLAIVDDAVTAGAARVAAKVVEGWKGGCEAEACVAGMYVAARAGGCPRALEEVARGVARAAVEVGGRLGEEEPGVEVREWVERYRGGGAVAAPVPEMRSVGLDRASAVLADPVVVAAARRVYWDRVLLCGAAEADQLVDLDEDEEVSGMVLSREEAEVKERYWVVENGDWLVRKAREARGEVEVGTRKRRKSGGGGGGGKRGRRKREWAARGGGEAFGGWGEDEGEDMEEVESSRSRKIDYDALHRMFDAGGEERDDA